MASTPFFNLHNAATEHCLAWLIRSDVIDPAAFVAEHRRKTAVEFDALPLEEKKDVRRKGR